VVSVDVIRCKPVTKFVSMTFRGATSALQAVGLGQYQGGMGTMDCIYQCSGQRLATGG
jgi:hypothetical protein